MAHDDDYWRWRNRMDDQAWLAKRASDDKRALNEAMRDRNWARARQVTDVPPPDVGSDDLDDLDDFDNLDDFDDLDDLDGPEHDAPPTAGTQFREHKRSLLFNLEWADGFLPRELLADWARRVEPLDIVEAEAGLAAIEAIGDEYRQASYRYEPPNSEASRRIDWDYYVPRIGEEIDWLARLFRHVLSFE